MYSELADFIKSLPSNTSVVLNVNVTLPTQTNVVEDEPKIVAIHVWHQKVSGGYQVFGVTNPAAPAKGAKRFETVYATREEAWAAAEKEARRLRVPLRRRAA
jgi:hypothetical protein